MNRIPIYYVGTTEYVRVSVTADVELVDQTVELSLDRGTTWLPCEWVGEPSTTRSARTTAPVTFTSSHKTGSVSVKVIDSPEVPIIDAGILNVTAR